MSHSLAKLPKTLFITGTNTHVGKTYIATRLLDDYAKKGLSTLGLKPIASGALHTPAGLRNEDALALQTHATVKLAYEDINPFIFPEPIAPHIAAQRAKQTLSVEAILKKLSPVLAHAVDKIIIEGAGGLLTPLNAQETLVDLIKALHCPVILVVHMTLGCLNHALLTRAHLAHHHIPLAGWVANTIGTPMDYLAENTAYLTQAFELEPLHIE